VRWDDLQLLRLIDELEKNEQVGQLSSGYELIRAASGDQPIDWDRDTRTFTRELLLARVADYLEWVDQFHPGSWQPDPAVDAQQWLQQIRDLRLTLAGRDRARGRVILTPLPDPDEDDDRPITGMTLEEVARAIGDTYTGSQLPRYLYGSGIPEQFILAEVPASKWEYVLGIFEALHDGGSAARRALRQFIGGWLEGPSPPSSRRNGKTRSPTIANISAGSRSLKRDQRRSANARPRSSSPDGKTGSSRLVPSRFARFSFVVCSSSSRRMKSR
jgi:hypothetical protein